MQTDITGHRLRTGMLIKIGFPDEVLRIEWWPHRKMWVGERLAPHDPTPSNIMGLDFKIIDFTLHGRDILRNDHR